MISEFPTQTKLSNLRLQNIVFSQKLYGKFVRWILTTVHLFRRQKEKRINPPTAALGSPTSNMFTASLHPSSGMQAPSPLSLVSPPHHSYAPRPEWPWYHSPVLQDWPCRVDFWTTSSWLPRHHLWSHSIFLFIATPLFDGISFTFLSMTIDSWWL